MAGRIIMCVVCFGCGILFYAIGAYAQKLTKPMWFWSGTEVDASQIRDIKRYNKENATMWKLYSLWYFAAGAAEFYNPLVAVILMVSGSTVGGIILVFIYNRIFKKYKAR